MSERKDNINKTSDQNLDDQYLNVNYEMKNQLKLFVGERSKTAFDSGCKMFDLFLKEPHQVFLSSLICITFY
jgi:hypothetical protein